MKGIPAAILIVFCLPGFQLKAQRTFLDSSLNFPMVKFGYGLQFPGGDLVNRFGTNSAIEGEVLMKYKSNFVTGIKGSFIYGNTVKERDILDNIKTESGNVIDNGGDLGSIYFEERGYSIFGTVGKLFPVLSPNVNSGFIITIGAGMLQHKIRMDYRDSRISNLDKEYRKGYDRLSNGFAIQGFIGYIFLSNKRLINFYAGFDCLQAWTQNRRGFNFDTMAPDDIKRIDNLSGFKIGWILPLYKNQPDEFYYY